MRYLIPDYVVNRLLDVTPQDIRALSPETRVVCMDIDGTVTDYHAPSVPEDAQERIRSFTSAGLLTVIVSNCSGARVDEVHRLFGGLVTEVMTPADCVDPSDPKDSGRRHRKPSPDMLLEAASRLTVTDPGTGAARAVRPAEMLMIGDQMFKDVLVARRAGTKAVLLPRLGSHDHLGVRFLQRPVETVLRALWRLPVRAGDWPGRLTAVGGRPAGATGVAADDGGRRRGRAPTPEGARVLDPARRFAAQHARSVMSGGRTWRYHRLGSGPVLVWLTGGLRRAALGWGFMERLAATHTVIAPDYPPFMTVAELCDALDRILTVEGVESFTLGGQSYGGILAQAYLARRPAAVDKLILSSSGPADFARAWGPVEAALAGLARLLPERLVTRLVAPALVRVVSAPPGELADWQSAVRTTVQRDLTRADVVSHFAVAADMIRRRVVTPEAFRGWGGSVVVLTARKDPTQRPKDLARLERLFGRPVRVIDMGTLGHTAALADPERYARLLEQALTS